MSPALLRQMHQEMQEVLEYNFTHFYTTFKDLIVDELVDNFEHVLCQINNGRHPENHSRYHQRFDLPVGYLEEVKNPSQTINTCNIDRLKSTFKELV
jgi:hypothetical protein